MLKIRKKSLETLIRCLLTYVIMKNSNFRQLFNIKLNLFFVAKSILNTMMPKIHNN